MSNLDCADTIMSMPYSSYLFSPIDSENNTSLTIFYHHQTLFVHKTPAKCLLALKTPKYRGIPKGAKTKNEIAIGI